MTVQELITKLGKLPPTAPIMVLDGHNGGGAPREINLGPVSRRVTAEDIEAAIDCEEFAEGTEVHVLGYGCY